MSIESNEPAPNPAAVWTKYQKVLGKYQTRATSERTLILPQSLLARTARKLERLAKESTREGFGVMFGSRTGTEVTIRKAIFTPMRFCVQQESNFQMVDLGRFAQWLTKNRKSELSSNSTLVFFHSHVGTPHPSRDLSRADVETMSLEKMIADAFGMSHMHVLFILEGEPKVRAFDIVETRTLRKAREVPIRIRGRSQGNMALT